MTTNADDRDYELLHRRFADEQNDAEILAKAAEIMARANAQPEPVEPVVPKSVPADGFHVFHVTGHGSLTLDGKAFLSKGEELRVSRESLTTEQMTDERSRTNQFDRWVAEGRIVAGPFPLWRRTWVYGSSEWQAERTNALAQARAVVEPEARADAIAHVEAWYGPASFSPSAAETYYLARMEDFHEWASNRKAKR